MLVLDYEPARIDPETKASTQPEDIEKCLKAGILPDCYAGKDIELELETPDDSGKDLAYFIRNEDGTVICPMGQILRQAKMRGKDIIYQNRRACHQCQRYSCRDFKNKMPSDELLQVIAEAAI